MANPYVKSRQSQLSRNYYPYMNVSPNLGYSWYQDDTQMTAQALYRENSIGKLLIDSYCRLVIGKGLSPMASPETKILGWTDEQTQKFQEQSEAYWRIMTDSTIDFYGKNSFYEIQKIAFRDICINGDTLEHLGYRKIKESGEEMIVPFVQTISGRMVTNQMKTDTKDCIGGVLFTKGKESGYQIRILNPDFGDSGRTRRVNRYNSLGRLAFNLVQLGQTDPSIVRGVPLLSTLRDDVLDINRFKDNHLMQSVIQNLFTAFVTHEEPSNIPISEKLKEVGQTSAKEATDVFLSTGNVVDLEVGENVVFSPRNTQASDFNEGLKSYIGLVASSLGMSYETAMNTYNASYSASRAGISGTEKNAEIVRLEFIRKYCQPVWENVIEHGILTGHIQAPNYDASWFKRKAMFATTWTGITPPLVDLGKDVNAYATAVDKGLCSREFAIKMLFGMDFDEVADRTNKELNQTEDKGPNSEEDTDSDKEGDNDNE